MTSVSGHTCFETKKGGGADHKPPLARVHPPFRGPVAGPHPKLRAHCRGSPSVSRLTCKAGHPRDGSVPGIARTTRPKRKTTASPRRVLSAWAASPPLLGDTNTCRGLALHTSSCARAACLHPQPLSIAHQGGVSRSPWPSQRANNCRQAEAPVCTGPSPAQKMRSPWGHASSHLPH